MTPGARLQAVIELLERVETQDAPADGILTHYFRKRRYAGSKDRRAVAERLYGLLRHRARLDWRAERWGLEPCPRTRLLADLALNEGLSAAEANGLFGSGPYAPPPLSPEEETFLNALSGQPLPHPDMPAWVAGEYPDWLEGALSTAYGGGLEREAAALNEAAPVDLRVNTAKATREEAKDLLGGEGIETSPCPHAPCGLRLKSRANVTGTKAFQDGLVEIQDEGSQIVALLTAAQPGMTAVDFCAGAGGKTLALAATMEGQGRVHACDTDVSRLKRMNERLRRAKPGNVRSHTLVKDDPWIAEQAEQADRVLVDAPCSGSGAWRRAPEAKWRLTPGKLAGYCAAQSQILEQAKGLVKPGGRLVFATCSILGEENEDRAERFLDANPDFSLMDGAAIWADVLGRPCPVAGPMLRLGPAATYTDGFFCAVFERTLRPALGDLPDGA